MISFSFSLSFSKSFSFEEKEEVSPFESFALKTLSLYINK